MSFQEYNFNKIARSLHQLGELVFELQGGEAMLSLPSKKKKKKNVIQAAISGWLPTGRISLSLIMLS